VEDVCVFKQKLITYTQRGARS